MFTSRAEYRLLLRHDNADRRLTPLGWRVGLVAAADWERLTRKEHAIAELQRALAATKYDGDTLERWLRRTETSWEQILAWSPELAQFAPAVIEQVVLESKYAGYIDRQATQVERFRKMESRRIPSQFDFAAVPQLRVEAREKLGSIRPTSLGQASRISGISPADLAVVMMYLDAVAE